MVASRTLLFFQSGNSFSMFKRSAGDPCFEPCGELKIKEEEYREDERLVKVYDSYFYLLSSKLRIWCSIRQKFVFEYSLEEDIDYCLFPKDL